MGITTKLALNNQSSPSRVTSHPLHTQSSSIDHLKGVDTYIGGYNKVGFNFKLSTNNELTNECVAPESNSTLAGKLLTINVPSAIVPLAAPSPGTIA